MISYCAGCHVAACYTCKTLLLACYLLASYLVPAGLTAESGQRVLTVLPDLWVAVAQRSGQELRGLLEASVQVVQLLLHGQDALLQLPVRVVPVGAQVAHDHLHLLMIKHSWAVISYRPPPPLSLMFCNNGCLCNIEP